MRFQRIGFWPYFAVIAVLLTAAFFAGSFSGQALPTGGEGRGRLIMIDPGHGGEDGGAASETGIRESDVNLSVSLRLRDLLRLCGMETAMTRKGDCALYDPGCTTIAQKKSSDLRNRAAMCSEHPDAILLSIHQNHFPEGKYRGAQVFYNDASGSEALANSLQEALREGVDPKNHRQIKRALSVYLMEHVGNTAALIECGFLSNREEAMLLLEPDYQKKLVCGICAGLMRNQNVEILL